MKNQPFILARFSEKKYIDQFQKEGLIFMNTFQKFKDSEEKERGDKHENITFIMQPKLTKININGFTPSVDDFVGPITFTTHDIKEHNYSNIFCMAGIYDGENIREDRKIFDERLLEIGDTVLIIYNLNEFISRLKKAISNEGDKGNIVYARANRVEYIDENIYHGEIGPFRKFSSFSHQAEWRIAILSNLPDKAFRFKMGSIEDISWQVAKKDFKNIVEIDENGKQHIIF